MTGLAVREPTEADAAAISALCNALTRSLYGEADVDTREVRTWFALPDLAMFLVERDAELCGYADVRRESSGTRFPIDLGVAPVRARHHVAEALLAAIETWARERMQPGSIARAFVAERDAEVAKTLGSRGYRLIRHFYTMEIRLADRLEQPEWPDRLSVRTFDRARDEEAVYECVQESFADHWDYHRVTLEEFQSLMLRDGFDPGLWWLVEDGGELAGVCLNAWHLSGDRTFGWIGTLGVRRFWRRRGLGLALLCHSFADFAERGASRVGLGVDAENTTGAVRLYERAGMRAVRRNDTWEKAL